MSMVPGEKEVICVVGGTLDGVHSDVKNIFV